jgi:enamine deaminase RidA (YjgF/YER057c/UK114 family)
MIIFVWLRCGPAADHVATCIDPRSTSWRLLGEAFKVQVFLRNLTDFNNLDEVWKEYFKTPSQTTIGTSEPSLPMHWSKLT